MGWSRKPAMERGPIERSPPLGKAYSGGVGAAGDTYLKKNLYSNSHTNHLGTMRHPAKGRSSLKRAWFLAVAVATVILLACISPLSSSIPEALYYPWSPTKLVASNLYANEVRSESRQLVWERGQVEHKISIPVVSDVSSASNGKDSGAGYSELPAIIIAADGARLQILDPNSRNETGEGSRSTSGSDSSIWPAHLPYIEDVVALPDGVDLLLVRNLATRLHRLKITACRYDQEEGATPQLRSEPSIIDIMPDGRLAVTCTRPVVTGLGQNQTTKAWPRIEDISLELENLVEEEEMDEDEDENENGNEEDENDADDLFSSKSLIRSDIDSSNSTSLLVLPRLQKDVEEPYQWGKEALVYMLQVTDEDVVLYAKRVFSNPKSTRKDLDDTQLQNLRCVFEFEDGPVQTVVTAAALEVYRCGHPDLKDAWPLTSAGTRVKVHMLFKGTRIPSIAYYEPKLKSAVDGRAYSGGSETDFQDKEDRMWPNLDVGLLNRDRASAFDHDHEEGKRIAEVREPMEQHTKKKYLVCSCTMIWNMAKFLKEWVHFNSDLGVEKFFLYDNNSEDDIESVVSGLNALGRFKVSRTIWPWVKTQEAGFSHCAIEAQRECTWVLFTDVDEYIFPKRWLGIASGGKASKLGLRKFAPGDNTLGSSVGTDISTRKPLHSLIKDTIKSSNPAASGGRTSKTTTSSQSIDSTPTPTPLKLGQISFHCRNFGPSGFTLNPPQGVTQGYTCRDEKELRHKSLLYFPAVASSTRNVIHHFFLKPGYRTVQMDARQVVINHYKFQAWSEFKTKFEKRASTYVVDWKEPKNLGSRDRPEGLGFDAAKPADWETSHCERRDTALKDYVRERFGIQQGYFWKPSIKMAWEEQ